MMESLANLSSMVDPRLDGEHEEEEEEQHLIGVDSKLGVTIHHPPSSSTKLSQETGTSPDDHHHHLRDHHHHHHHDGVVHHHHHEHEHHSTFSKGIDLGVAESDGVGHHDGLRSDSVVGELSTVLGGEGSSGAGSQHLADASVVDLYSSNANPYSSPFVVYPAGFYPNAFSSMMDRTSSFPGTSLSSSSSYKTKKNEDGLEDRKLHVSSHSSRELEDTSSTSPKTTFKNPVFRAVDLSHAHPSSQFPLSLTLPTTPPSLLSINEQQHKDSLLKDDFNMVHNQHSHSQHNPAPAPPVPESNMMHQGMSSGMNFMANPMMQNLRYSGLLSEVMPDTAVDPISARIRVWLDAENKLYYDCFCGKRKPIRNLKGIKHHCARHDHQVFQCEKCDRVFTHYLGLNSHRKAHREEEPIPHPPVPVPPHLGMDPTMHYHSSI
jgi:hypothetical protein